MEGLGSSKFYMFAVVQSAQLAQKVNQPAWMRFDCLLARGEVRKSMQILFSLAKGATTVQAVSEPWRK